jgi:hypothetical protein
MNLAAWYAPERRLNLGPERGAVAVDTLPRPGLREQAAPCETANREWREDEVQILTVQMATHDRLGGMGGPADKRLQGTGGTAK